MGEIGYVLLKTTPFQNSVINVYYMKTFVILLIFFTSIFFASAQKVYTTSNPSRADVKVFVVDKYYRADLIVFRTNKEYKSKANENRGIWFFCDKEFKSDIKIHFVDKEYRAGWKNLSKKYLFF